MTRQSWAAQQEEAENEPFLSTSQTCANTGASMGCGAWFLIRTCNGLFLFVYFEVRAIGSSHDGKNLAQVPGNPRRHSIQGDFFLEPGFGHPVSGERRFLPEIGIMTNGWRGPISDLLVPVTSISGPGEHDRSSGSDQSISIRDHLLSRIENTPWKSSRHHGHVNHFSA